MRGLPVGNIYLVDKLGITPAHAGLTLLNRDLKAAHWDHPRACGAYKRLASRIRTISGSPPRMRGLLTLIAGGCTVVGITPAHAGLTAGWLYGKRWNRDHPRACGAYAGNVPLAAF